ncbi:hypothetical protein [Sporisorium scitamineum]|uniref:Uncharacterized protein n=1 Tax=Sporisorium scitamineum TaxID=49012 RepID=A0A0F7RXK0_9BASI|nr:hypothetical protein [Sporisorium scitamineum]
MRERRLGSGVQAEARYQQHHLSEHAEHGFALHALFLTFPPSLFPFTAALHAQRQADRIETALTDANRTTKRYMRSPLRIEEPPPPSLRHHHQIRNLPSSLSIRDPSRLNTLTAS